MSEQRIELTLDAAGERLDKAIPTAVPELSRTQAQRLIKAGQITVDGRIVKPNLKLAGGEQITIILPPVQETELLPEDIPLDIRYEDTDMLVINKPAGMVAHPAVGHESGTLVNAVLFHCPDLAGIGGEKRPGIVHRLDKDTSGLIVVAKNESAMRHLQAQFKERTVDKRYLALVEGQMNPPEALIDAPIGRDPRQRKKMAVIPLHYSARSRPAQTEYRTVISFDDYTLVECHLLTGRTHQIRVHLAYAGFPIVGDTVYGRRKQTIRLKRHFLHAARLTLLRPSDNTPLSLEAELPPELTAVLQQLETI
ncbi:MAG TPA: RluA family pseudouridine synthase [Anaerolineae bacterium]|nr:RluA family pseudouridine synthase [Anaerolineae bacterium]HIP72102.1 RluA family pseudouridine synthase [Anaerolineae bacterium]